MTHARNQKKCDSPQIFPIVKQDRLQSQPLPQTGQRGEKNKQKTQMNVFVQYLELSEVFICRPASEADKD